MENAFHTNTTGFHDSGSLLTGLLFGGLAGFGVMMLFAPRSGKKTCVRIMEKSTQLQDRMTDTFDELVALSHFDNRKILTGTRGLKE